MKRNTSFILGALTLGSMLISSTAFAADSTQTQLQGHKGMGHHMMLDGTHMRGGGAQIAGNGQPVVGGSVTAVAGATLTLTNKGSATYTVDATSATVIKAGATSTLSSVVVGDRVMVQGAVTGSAVVATSIVDSGVAPAIASTTTKHTKGFGGMFGGMGGFFHSMFGFF